MENTPRGNLPRGEARTKRLKEMFPWNEYLTRKEILAKLRQEGMIGSGLIGIIKGEMILRRGQLLKEEGDTYTTNYFFFKDTETGKFTLTHDIDDYL